MSDDVRLKVEAGRANNDRTCQKCNAKLILGEPVLRVWAMFKAQSREHSTGGAYCAKCAAVVFAELPGNVAKAVGEITKRTKELESFYVARELAGEQDRGKLTAMLRKALPPDECHSCFHPKSEHVTEPSAVENGVSYVKCEHISGDPLVGTSWMCHCAKRIPQKKSLKKETADNAQ